MSTRSAIIVKVKKEDIGKVMKFQAEKLGIKVSGWECYGEPTKEDGTDNVKLTCQYIGVYCHFDGYLEGVGAVLKEKFSDYDKALNLVLGGQISALESNYFRHYANREEGLVWEDIAPSQNDDLQSLADHILGHNFVYVYDNGWKYNEDGITDKLMPY